ncbi:unnamed protein product [Amoebophrya sp. A25]|nr:unnamed protein product [Amoebophrya sp. A25]|eukprot:GSA25T00013083001.1
MKALRDQVDARFMESLAQPALPPPPPAPTNVVAPAPTPPPPAAAAEPAAPAKPKTLAEEFADLAKRDAQAKRAVRDPARLKNDPRMRMLIAQYLDEYPLVKQFLEDES